jgi:VanZ family protein
MLFSFRPFRWEIPINAATRTPHKICLDGPGLLKSPRPAGWLGNVIQQGEFMLRLRVSPSSIDQSGPARIFTVSVDTLHRNLTIGQEGSSLIVRLRTTDTTLNGTPPYVLPATFRDSQWSDIDLSICDGQLTLQIDGNVVVSEQLPAAPLENWDPSYHVALGNELTGDRPWLGEISRAEVEVNGELFNYLNGEVLEQPAFYRPMPGWKAIMVDPFLSENANSKADAMLNLICFIPLGFVLGFVRPTRGSFWAVVVFVAVLSLLVELCQLGFAQRFPSCLDWLMNVFGAALGVEVARLFVLRE